MFHSARLKLTAWYLVIILLIGFFFSSIIYFGVSRELERGFHRYEMMFRLRARERREELMLIRRGILLRLLSTNIVITLTSAFASYFLAGKTLRPIEEMMNEQNRFITDSSHELRTPLTALKTSIEVSLRDKTLSLEDAKKVLRSNLEEIDSLQSLTDNLLTLAQFQKANGSLTFDMISLKDVIDEAVKKVLPLARAKQITIKQDVQDYSLKTDKKSIIDLVVILLDNAIKYSPKKKSVKISTHKDGHSLSISVKDYGMGIEETDLPYIFDRFYRADTSRSKSTVSGFGLGLSIAKKIVEVHKGTIDVESIPGKQTTFTIKLPINS